MSFLALLHFLKALKQRIKQTDVAQEGRGTQMPLENSL